MNFALIVYFILPPFCSLFWPFLVLSPSTVTHRAPLCPPDVQLLTKGCETSEMTLRRNGLGQLGFHVNYEGIVAEVSLRKQPKGSSENKLDNNLVHWHIICLH